MIDSLSDAERQKIFKDIMKIFYPTELKDGTPIPKDVDAKKALYDKRLAMYCAETDPETKRDYGTDAYVLWVEWSSQAGMLPGYWLPHCPET